MKNIAGNFDQGVTGTTQDDYCRKQIAEGLNPSTCAARFAAWKARSANKGQKMAERWKE